MLMAACREGWGGGSPFLAGIGQLQMGAGLRRARKGVFTRCHALMHIGKADDVPHDLLHDAHAHASNLLVSENNQQHIHHCPCVLA